MTAAVPSRPGRLPGGVPAGERRARPPLRAWQREALDAYESERRSDFLVTATPGAGKTTFALALAAGLLERREVDRVVVVCPTDHLRTQWAEAAAAVGLVLDPTLSNAVGPVRSDAQGYVSTYAQVAGKPMLHRARSSTRRSLVVLDEVHHAGDGLSWGDAVEEAFGGAARRVCLTGTPFRTRPEERIPFVRYTADGGGGLESSADYTYGYREALRDGVVRPVVFAAYTGTSRWRNSAGEVVAASLSEPGTRGTEAIAWRTALDPRGQWVPHVIAAMDERISHLRAHGVPDAAGLVLASDQEDARAYARIVEQVTGEPPEVILSDDPRASERIARFATGSTRVAVCVRMVSEGVDVVRATCLAWMTSYRTPLFFAQAVGRVVRSRGAHESATVFLPAVRPLLALAAELEDERNHVVPPPPADSADLDPLPPLERAEAETTQWEALDAEARFAHVLHSGRAHVGDDRLPLGDDEDDFLGLPGLLTPEQTAVLLARRDTELRRRASGAVRPRPGGATEVGAAAEPGGPAGGGEPPAAHAPPSRAARPRPGGATEVGAAAEPGGPAGGGEPPAEQATSWRAAGELRREVNRLVAQVAARTGTPHSAVHAQVRREVPGPASAAAGAALLQRRRDALLLRLAAGR